MSNINSLPSDTTVGAVRLQVTDLKKALSFYEGVLGMQRTKSKAGEIALSASADSEPLVILRENRSAKVLRRPAPGLFHLAILLPDRADLGRVLLQLSKLGWPLQGASDHLVSEALYLADPDGNGIEIYIDRPSDQWTWSNGEVSMATEPMDIRSVIAAAEAQGTDWTGLPAGTRMGHVHLQVSNVERSAAFYNAVIGLDITTRSYPGARFLSAGRYHHHLGLNAWRTDGAEAAGEDSAGLIDWELILPDDAARQALLARAEADGSVREIGNEQVIVDPDGLRLNVRGS